MNSEKNKMMAGEYYDASHEELVGERIRARDLAFEFNSLPPSQKRKRDSKIKELIDIKGDFTIESPFYCDYGWNIHIGERFYANFGCTILDVNKVEIGDDVLLAPNVQIYTADHPTNPDERLEGKEYALPIKIGNNVWIGGGSIICPGVTIGDNVTIGAGSVVTKDVPENSVAVGNPCKVIRKSKE